MQTIKQAAQPLPGAQAVFEKGFVVGSDDGLFLGSDEGFIVGSDGGKRHNVSGIRSLSGNVSGNSTGRSRSAVEYWNDGEHESVKSITAIVKDGSLTSIQFQYVDSGGRIVIDCPTHGGGSEGDIKKFDLDYPDEYLVNVSGVVDARRKIKSLTFQTNIRKFSTSCGEIPGGSDAQVKIIGLFGAAGQTAIFGIGVHTMDLD